MSDVSSFGPWPADTGISDRWTVYTRGNVGEVYPDVVSPLEWDLGGLASENGWRRGAEAIGFLRPGDYGSGDFVLVGVCGGYAYFNAALMRLLGVRTPGLSAQVIDQQFLGEADIDAYVPRKGDRNLAATARTVQTALKTLTAKRVPLVDEMRRRADQVRNDAPPLDATDEELWNGITERLDEDWEWFIASHVQVTMQATIAAGSLTDLCEKHLGDPSLAVALTTGIGDVVSAEPARVMWKLANETAPEDFDAAFAGFLKKYGHRGPNEFSMMGRDWAAYPEVAMAAIDTMRELDPERSPERQLVLMKQRRIDAMASAKALLGRRAGQLDRAVRSTVVWSRAREASKDEVIRAAQSSRHRLLELIRRAHERGGEADPLGPMLLSAEEFPNYVADPASMSAVIAERLRHHRALRELKPPYAFDAASYGGSFPAVAGWGARTTTGIATAAPGDVLTGAAGAPGVASGTARIITDPGDPGTMSPGDILVAPLTDPAWTPLFVGASAVVVEIGAAMSHSMIVSREMGIPCVAGVEGATSRIAEGAVVEVDGQAGTVKILS